MTAVDATGLRALEGIALRLRDSGRAAIFRGAREQPRAVMVVVFAWVAVNGFVLAAMDAEVSLTVTVQIEPAQRDAAFDRLLENGRRHVLAVPGDVLGEPSVH